MYCLSRQPKQCLGNLVDLLAVEWITDRDQYQDGRFLYGYGFALANTLSIIVGCIY